MRLGQTSALLRIANHMQRGSGWLQSTPTETSKHHSLPNGAGILDLYCFTEHIISPNIHKHPSGTPIRSTMWAYGHKLNAQCFHLLIKREAHVHQKVLEPFPMTLNWLKCHTLMLVATRFYYRIPERIQSSFIFDYHKLFTHFAEVPDKVLSNIKHNHDRWICS